MSIINLLNQIKNNEIVLPAIQRDFVWPEDKVLRLLDSIMRGYLHRGFHAFLLSQVRKTRVHEGSMSAD